MTQLRYRFIQALRLRTNIFWGLFFPLALATLFRIAFGGILSSENFEPVKTAVVITEENKEFLEMIKKVDGETLTVSYLDRESAEEALRSEEVSGIFYCDESPSLVVSGNGMQQTILSTVLSSYEEYGAILEEMAEEHPERIEAFWESIGNDTVQYTRSVSLGGKTYNVTLEYFFALLAMACFFGCYTGQALGEQSAANVSPLAARRAVSPRHKLLSVLTDMFVGFTIQFLNVLILLAYLDWGLGIDLSAHLGGMIVIVALGSLLGVSFGILVGTMNVKEGGNVLLTTALSLVLCFLAGLMYGSMKQVIENSVPFLNRLNPAAVISDAFYYLNVYEDKAGYYLRLVILAAYSFGITALAFIMLRRERYDSI